MKLQKKCIIVTGGNGLIGQSIIKNLTDNGAAVINADLNVDSSLSHSYQHSLECDVTKKVDVDKLISFVIDKYGRIDGLVNGAYPRTEDWMTSFHNIKYESWEKNVQMQLNSCFYICQSTLAIMKKQNSGSIVNLASVYGIVGNDFSIYEQSPGITSPAAYSAIKGGIINFTRYLASLYGEFNVRVNAVSPGGVFSNKVNKNLVKNYSAKTPMKRMADSKEIAPAVSFLLSEEASYITGHNLVIDGGWTCI